MGGKFRPGRRGTEKFRDRHNGFGKKYGKRATVNRGEPKSSSRWDYAEFPDYR